MKNKGLFGFLILSVFSTLLFSFNFSSFQEESKQQTDTEAVQDGNTEAVQDGNVEEFENAQPQEADSGLGVSDSDTAQEEPTFHHIIKTKFIEGGAGFMGVVLLALILGLSLCIERIIYLYFAETSPKRIISAVETAIEQGGFNKAKGVCRDTKGPIASIFYQGFDRVDQGVEVVEKAVVSYGGVQMGLLERNISWISLFIALAPMLGFMGTVIGMISAFDSIEAAGDISPTLVAKGIKQALLTTVFGLIVAIILQIFYNYIVAKVDKIVNEMEDASISLIDIIIKYQK